MNTRYWAPTAALALLCSTAIPAAAADLGATYEPAGESGITFWGGVGVAYIEANEYVYAGSGSTDITSQLIWQSTAPILSGGFDVALPEGWTAKGTAQFAIAGDSYMEDYDWFGPDFVSYDFDDWTHRSQHDDTNLDWYFNGSLLVGYDFAVDDSVTVNLNGGFKYTDVQWTAYGGEFVYSGFEGDPAGHYHDYVGSFPDGEKGITYRQSFPALVAGADIEADLDALTLSAGVQGGFTFYGVGDDHHWMRDLNFVDSLASAPLVAAHASAEMEVADGMTLFAQGTVEKIFAARGDTDVYDIPTGDFEESFADGAGGELFAASLSVGFKGTF